MQRDERMAPGGLRVRKQQSRGSVNRQTSADKYSQPVLATNQPLNMGMRRNKVPPGPAGSNPLRAKSQNRTTIGANKYQSNPQQRPGGKENSAANIQGDVVNFLKDELLATWEAYLIPDYHRTVFLDCIFGLKPQ